MIFLPTLHLKPEEAAEMAAADAAWETTKLEPEDGRACEFSYSMVAEGAFQHQVYEQAYRYSRRVFHSLDYRWLPTSELEETPTGAFQADWWEQRRRKAAQRRQSCRNSGE